jgi:hypothetical protein
MFCTRTMITASRLSTTTERLGHDRQRLGDERKPVRGVRLPGPRPRPDLLHTESDLRVFLRWRADQDLDPLAAVRVDIERCVRWLQDVRGYQPSTVS